MQNKNPPPTPKPAKKQKYKRRRLKTMNKVLIKILEQQNNEDK